MFKKKRSQLGIDIGNETIKLAILSPKKELEFWTQLPVPGGSIMTNTILEPEQIGLAIRSGLGIWEQDFDTTVAVSGHAVSLRLLKLPLLKKQELLAAVELESSHLLPFPLDYAYWDYQVTSQEEHTEVLVAAAEKKLVDGYISALASAQIVPRAVEPSSLSLARSLGRQLGDSLAGVLDLGAHCQELTIYAKGVPVFFRSLPGTARDLVATLPGGELMPALVELFRELRRSFDYIGRERGEAVEKLIVIGSSASEPGLPEILQNQLGIEVSVGDPSLELKIDPQDAATFPKELFAIALGLALRGVWEA